jgi:hypothetical protein
MASGTEGGTGTPEVRRAGDSGARRVGAAGDELRTSRATVTGAGRAHGAAADVE